MCVCVVGGLAVCVDSLTWSLDWCSQHRTQISLFVSIWERDSDPGRKLVLCLAERDTPVER